MSWTVCFMIVGIWWGFVFLLVACLKHGTTYTALKINEEHNKEVRRTLLESGGSGIPTLQVAPDGRVVGPRAN